MTVWHSGLRAASLLVLLLAGCASKDVNWDARRGKYSYDEAVRQYGEPLRVETLPDGGKAGYWTLPDVRTYDFKFQLTKFDGNSEGNLNPGKGDTPPGGRPLGSIGKPVLKLSFGSDDQLTSAVRLKDGAWTAPPAPDAPAPATPPAPPAPPAP